MCALIGIGGAGKTAIVNRFLQVLPGFTLLVSDVAKRNDLPVPERLFVFSFENAANPDEFFAELAEWLGESSGKANPETRVTYQQVLRPQFVGPSYLSAPPPALCQGSKAGRNWLHPDFPEPQ